MVAREHLPPVEAATELSPYQQYCFWTGYADRLGLLIDGEQYYGNLRENLLRARHSVYLLGWEMDSRAPLKGAEEPDRGPVALAEVLEETLRRNPRLHVHVLCWNYAPIYALERELLLAPRLRGRHRRLHFRYDASHPLGGCHHQKLVILDDHLAYCGGFDVSAHRWDTRAHEPDHPGRTAGDGPYGPFHDVQAMVQGRPAQALGALARQRWAQASGRPAPPREPGNRDWEFPELHWERVPLGIARTQPPYRTTPEVREVESLYRALITDARHSLYLENQYFTSHAVCEAFERMVQRESGAEACLILPQYAGGWLEQKTMGLLQRGVLEKIRQADAGGRFGVFYPRDERWGEDYLTIHSKVLVADLQWVFLGSANLTNRSMGLDSECNLLLAGASLARGVVAELLGEHSGLGSSRVARRLSLGETPLGIARQAVRETGRLRPFPRKPAPEAEALLQWTDMERPAAVERLSDTLVREDPSRIRRVLTSRFTLVTLYVVVLVVLWFYTPVGEYLRDPQRLAERLVGMRWVPLWMAVVYVAGGVLWIPLNLMVLLTASLFPPWQAWGYALGGALANGAVVYGLGRFLGTAPLKRHLPEVMDRIDKVLKGKRTLAVGVLRLVPVAPYTAVNLVLGALGVGLRPYLGGTLVGLLPGVTALVLLQGSLMDVLRNPNWQSVGGFVAVTAAVLAAVMWLRRRYGLREEAP